MDRVQHHGETISQEQRNLISQRYKRITKAINSEFWEIDSEIEHSLYVGSYGRGTAIDTSDIDILIDLPRSEYERYDAHKGNGQSRLLQVVKEAILATYPNSDVHADGQVIVINFSNGIKFEVLPAFKQVDWIGNNWNGKYDYPDTNMGGHWRSTNPKAEQDAMQELNRESKGLLFDTCKHMRKIRDTYFSGYHLSGIVIDSYVYHHIGDWQWLNKGEVSRYPIGTYEKKLCGECSSWYLNLRAPGSGDAIETTKDLECLQKVLNYMARD